MSPRHFDVCVVGGGPAGAATACRLARLGYQVALLVQASRPRELRVESVSERADSLLEELDIDLSTDSEFCARTHPPNFEDDLRPGEFSSASSQMVRHVDRQWLDERLVERARQWGVCVWRSGRARVTACADGTWTASIAGGEPVRVVARWLVDAAGKVGAIRVGRKQDSARTLAVSGLWATEPRAALARIESLPSAWCWSAPAPGGNLQVTVFADPTSLGHQMPPERCAWYLQSLAETKHFRAGLNRLLSPGLVVRDASASSVFDPVGAGWIQVGDAACAIDPLSSQGVHLALTAGFAAAAVINTCLNNPERRTLAEQFYRDRHQDIISTHQRLSAQVYGRLAARFPTTFWRQRTGAPHGRAAAAEHVPQPPHPGTPVASRIQLSPNVRLVTTGTLQGDSIRPETGALFDTWSKPVVLLGGVPIGRLLSTLQGALPTRELINAWSRDYPQPLVEKLLLWLWQQEILVAGA